MNSQISWGNISAFLALTFGLDWFLALFIYLNGGFAALAESVGIFGLQLLLQLYMLFPAFSAIFLQLFIFKESFLYFRTYQERPRLFYYWFLIFTILYVVLALVFMVSPAMLQSNVTYVPLGLALVGLLFAVILWIKSGKASFERAGLSFGSSKNFIFYSLFFVALYSGMTLLNIIFNLGEFVDLEQFIATLPTPETTEQTVPLTPTLILFSAGINMILLGPFLGLMFAFGEEYGWRGYLQNELTKMGRVRGVLVVGLIWGIWHAPIIAMGHNYPGHPVLGIVLMTLYTIGLAFILGLAYFQSRSVWLVAYLHALNNQVLSFFVTLVYLPNDMAFAFGIGIYGLVVLGLVVFLLLRHHLWREPLGETERRSESST